MVPICSQLAEDLSQFCAVCHFEGPEAQGAVQAGGQRRPLEEGAGSWQNVEFFVFCDWCGPLTSEPGQVSVKGQLLSESLLFFWDQPWRLFTPNILQSMGGF